MVAAAAATSILSLCGSSALADTSANGAAKDSPGVLSGNDVSAPVEVPVNACGNTVDAAAALNPSFGNDCATVDDEAKDGSYGAPYGDSEYGYDHDDYHDDYHDHDHDDHGSGASGDSKTEGSPGVAAGNGVSAPADVPVQLCGNTADVISGLNPVFGNDCGHEESPDGGYGDDHGHGDDYGHGGDDGHGGDGYGDTPPTKPPTTPPGGGHTPPPNGGGHTPPPPGGDHTPPPNGGGHTPPPNGGGHTPPPPNGGDHTPPPNGGHTGPPPSLPETGSGEAMLAASGASAALIAGGAVLYRRGRAASRR
ncbi:chaplin [Streptomyces sp. NBC_00287]|uniref:chaplin n=1 Tax=Streptomyces sp. NBC_00287 TaxID=2975702 RepID=UPI002E2A5F4F|nr:chaplin [Streptomyces sp. NBC_00287]